MFDLLWNGCTSIGTLKYIEIQPSKVAVHVTVLAATLMSIPRHWCRIQTSVKSGCFHSHVEHPILNLPNFTRNGWYQTQTPKVEALCLMLSDSWLFLMGNLGLCSAPKLGFQVFNKDTRDSQLGQVLFFLISPVLKLLVNIPLNWKATNSHQFLPFINV